MQQRFHLFVRRVPGRFWHLSVLTHPRYALFGRDFQAMRKELADVLARDLALDFLPKVEMFWPELELQTVDLEVRAVQQERLVTVPLRFTLCVRSHEDGRRTVMVPRLELTFQLRHADDLLPWAEERIRGALHLVPVHKLLTHQAHGKERVETLLVRWHGAGRYKKELQAKKVGQAAKAALEVKPALGGIGVDLVDEAKGGRLGRALHRIPEVDALVQALTRRRDRSVLLIGASGVGKTALVHELAHRIAQGRVPDRLKNAPLWHISGNRLMAGMMYVGDWQERALSIAKGVVASGGLLYVDNLLELLQAGSGRGGLNAGQLFLPFVQRDAFPLIAETTPSGQVRAEQIHPSFVRALRRQEVPGMPPRVAHQVLDVLAGRMARQARATLDDDALPTALELLERHGRSNGLPGSGLGLLEAMIRGNPGAMVGRSEALAAFGETTGLPVDLIDPDAGLDEDAVRTWFTERIVGQPEAIEHLVSLLLVLKAGLSDPGKPLGSLLCMGPTGVGKTESAKALATWLFGGVERLVRFDLSEYGAIGSAQRLVDGPGGQGLLTRAVREQPFSVLLFDEVEKAESGVFDVLLQVLGEGRLTDGTGHTVDFRHAIVLLTSNLGAADRPKLGLVRAEAPADRYLDAARRFFRPEFLNRLDAVVPYRSLDADSVRTIARGMLTEALSREGLSRRGVTVAWTDEVLDPLVAAGFDAKLGARPMKRAIEQLVLVPLARRLARGLEGASLQLVARGGSVLVE